MFPLDYLPVALFLSYTDLRKESVSSFLGLFWWVAEPLFNMLIFYFLFAVILNARTENFLAFLLIGLTTWRWLNVSTTQAAASVAASSGVISQVYLPKMMFPIRVILTNTFKFAVAFICLCVFVAATGAPFLDQFHYIPVLMLTQFTMILGISLCFSVLVAFIPDVQTLLGFTFRALFYVSGVLFDVSRVPQEYRIYIDLNPIANLLSAYRAVLMRGEAPDLGPILIILVASVVVTLIGLAAHARVDHVIPKIAR